MNPDLKAYQRLVIATELVKSSVHDLSNVNFQSEHPYQATLENLAVALYELTQLTQDINILLESTTGETALEAYRQLSLADSRTA